MGNTLKQQSAPPSIPESTTSADVKDSANTAQTELRAPSSDAAPDVSADQELYLVMSSKRRGSRRRAVTATGDNTEQLVCPVNTCGCVFPLEQHLDYDKHVHQHVSQQLEEQRKVTARLRGVARDTAVTEAPSEDRFHAILQATSSRTQQKITVAVGGDENTPTTGPTIRDPVVGKFETVLAVGPMSRQEAKDFAKRWRELTMHDPSKREEVGRQLMEEREQQLADTESDDEDNYSEFKPVTLEEMKRRTSVTM